LIRISPPSRAAWARGWGCRRFWGYGGDPKKRRAVADEIGEAARDIGFFRICDHGIPPELIEATYQAGRTFFAQADARKRRYYIANSTNHRGYVPFTEKGDYPDEVNRNYEAFDLGLDLPADDPDYLSGNRLLGPNVWPDLPGFKSIVGGYYTRISALGRLMCGALELNLGLPSGAITDQMTRPISPERFSLPYFVAANYDTVIAPFEQLVSEDTPARYKPFRAGAHLERMLMRDFPYLKTFSTTPIDNPFEKRMSAAG